MKNHQNLEEPNHPLKRVETHRSETLDKENYLPRIVLNFIKKALTFAMFE
jgi:hypothetical protein